MPSTARVKRDPFYAFSDLNNYSARFSKKRDELQCGNSNSSKI